MKMGLVHAFHHLSTSKYLWCFGKNHNQNENFTLYIYIYIFFNISYVSNVILTVHILFFYMFICSLGSKIQLFTKTKKWNSFLFNFFSSEKSEIYGQSLSYSVQLEKFADVLCYIIIVGQF